jgi:Terpene cyclase DEP1
MRTRLLLVLTVLGFVVPNVCLGIFIAEEGFDLSGYFSPLTDSTPSTQLLLDLAIASLAFFVWAAVDGPRAGVRRWWVCIPATLLVGLCFGLPLYLLMRERTLEQAGSAAT